MDARHIAKRAATGQLSVKEYALYGLIALALAATLLLTFKWVLLGLLILLTVVIVHLQVRFESIIDIAPVFIISLFVTHFYGLGVGMAFVILASVIPFFVGGGITDPVSFLFLGVVFALNVAFSLLDPSNVLLAAILFSLLYQVLGFVLSIFFYEPQLALLLSVGVFLADIAYALTLGRVIMFVMG